MRLLYLVIICAVGLVCALFGYWLATPNNPGVVSDDGSEHRLHDHESESSPISLASNSPEADWCAEHWVPESECTLCHPTLIEKFQADGNWCGEHNMPESHCRKCNPKLTFPQEPKAMTETAPVHASGVSVFFPANETGCTNDKALIQFASAETAIRSGIHVQPVVETRGVNSIESPAEIVFDQTQIKVVSTTVSASVVRWMVNPGQRVSAGQPLAELESPEIVEWLADYLNANSDWNVDSVKYQRAQDLRKSHLISDAEWEDAQAKAISSQNRLSGLLGKLQSAGISADDIAQTVADRRVSARFTLRAISDCTIIERRASLGELLPPGSTFALVGDGTAFWIEAHVRQQDIGNFTLGSRVQFGSDDQAIVHAEGTVIWIADYLDPTTRTGLVRARIEKSSSQLSANLFGRISAVSSANHASIMVPKDAVQWEGCCNIVFVQEAENRYRPHKVAIARGDSDYYAVLSGLQSGEMVVTGGSFFLKTELIKDKLGAGCTGE